MKNTGKILNGILIVLNCIITYFIASNRWVNRMPDSTIDNNFIKDFYELFLGQGLPTVIIPLITVIVLFAINKLIMKQKIKIKKCVFLFLIMFIINIIIYRIGIGVAV